MCMNHKEDLRFRVVHMNIIRGSSSNGHAISEYPRRNPSASGEHGTDVAASNLQVMVITLKALATADCAPNIKKFIISFPFL